MKYPSKYSNGKMVSAAQYITEIVCEHKAKREKKDLHYRFWVDKSWSRFYRDQIATANKLLKQYSAKAICMALNDDRASNIYSLRAPHLIPIIDQKEVLVSQENTELKQSFDRKANKTYQKNIQKNNILSRLKDLDNGS
jgi:hypothetical protein